MPDKRQRIMLAADSGCGKSHAALSFAEEQLLEHPDATIAVIDCDDSLEEILPKFPDVAAKLTVGGKRHNWWMIQSYNDLLTAATKVQQMLHAGDVLIFEGLERGWEIAQDYYSEQVFGKSPAEHLMSIRESRVAASKLDSPVSYDIARDWPTIRKLWRNEILVPLTTATSFHIVATTAAKEIVLLSADRSVYNVSPFIRGIYGEMGAAPEGEKHDTKRFSLAVVLGISGSRYIMSVAKNRSDVSNRRPQNINWTSMPFWATLVTNLAEETNDVVAPVPA